MPRAFYITGTDTGIGKTHASLALIHALRAGGRRVAGMKPVASGCEVTADGLRNEDALALQAAGDPLPAYGLVNPVALLAATAPEIAAARRRFGFELAHLLAAFERLREGRDALVVEGVGGWLAPLSASLMQADLVRALRLPAVLVVGLRLGCINHALLTLRALRADGVAVAGWIGNAIDPAFDFAAETRAILRHRLDAPCLGMLEHGVVPTQASLDLSALGV